MGPISSLVWGAIVSKIVNDGVDITKEKIKEAHHSHKDKTAESLIYQFTIDVLNNMTCSHYEKEKKMDTIYDTAEKLLNSVKAAESVVEEKIVAILKPLKFVGTTNEDILQNLEEAFYKEIIKKDNRNLVVIIGLKNSFDNKKDDLILLHNTSETNERLSKIEQMLQPIVENKVDLSKEKENHEIISETKKYLDRWNSNMFLNNPNKRDENPCIAVKLNDVYLNSQLPHYIWKNSKKRETDLKDLLNEYIIEDNEKMLLILGQPGIGKSTLITWITANYTNDNILVYGFTSSLKNLVWQKQNNDNIVDKIVKKLNLSYEKLENKILILDGFDEIDTVRSRTNIINSVYDGWKNESKLKNALLIITCRENYISDLRNIRCDYITLQAWNEGQINSFCNIYQEKTKIDISKNTKKHILKNNEILGIPLLLYMTLALNISIENEGSMVDIYDRIFALEGGIYDRCIENIKYDFTKHEISKIKEQVHELSKRIAIWMFENEPEKAFIPITKYSNVYENLNEEYKEKLENIEDKDNFSNLFTKNDVLIGIYFKLIKHCEGHNTDQLYFVHRSIYQYFIAETIYNSIEEASQELTEKTQINLAQNIVQYLKIGEIDVSIGDFLKRKVLKLYQNFGKEKQKNFYEWLDNSVCKMIDVGMFFYTNKNISNYENIIEKELICFKNLIIILQLLLDLCAKKFILQNANTKMLRKYIFLFGLKNKEYNLSRIYLKNINLKNVNLSNKNMSKSYLEEANLERALSTRTNLEGSYLKRANLERANLEKANLKEANLKEAIMIDAIMIDTTLIKTKLIRTFLAKADLTEADLTEASLIEAILTKANLTRANLTRADLTEADFEKANLVKADLIRSNLTRANLTGADLTEADFEKANLVKADLIKSNLTRTNLTEANLTKANLTETNLTEANLTEANLTRANFDTSILKNAILKNTKISIEKQNEIFASEIDINNIIWCD